MTDRIIEIGGAGLESADQRVKKLMDNMVGSEVPGYKNSSAVVRGFPLELEAATQKISSVKPQVEGSFYSNEQGPLIKTDSKLDVALDGRGFFVISGTWGEGYTRDGRFRLDKEGRLISVAGNFPVMGKGGPIIVTPGAQVEITQDGVIKADGVVVDTLRVVQPEQNSDLKQLSGSLFQKNDPKAALQEVPNPRVIQGYVEGSNVNIVDQMMEMIVSEQLYTLDSKIISTRDGDLTKALDLGKPTQ